MREIESKDTDDSKAVLQYKTLNSIEKYISTNFAMRLLLIKIDMFSVQNK